MISENCIAVTKFTLAVAQACQGKWREALPNYKIAHALFPDDEAYKKGLEYCNQRLNALEEVQKNDTR